MNWDKLKIHCSSLSSIMAGYKTYKTPLQQLKEAVALREDKSAMYEKLKTKDGPRGIKLTSEMADLDILIPKLEICKDEEVPLSTGCKSFLAGVYAYEKYGKWSPSKDIGSRQTEKGKEVEPDGLALVSVLDGVILEKNETRIEDNWFSGLPDAFEGPNVAQAEIVHDIKCPWDIESFFSVLGKPLSEQYYWQMQGYMALTDAKVAYVHFCLVNTPERFIKDTADKLLRVLNVVSNESPAFKQAEMELWNNMTFTDIPPEDRRIKFIVERNDEDIELARKRVEQCRSYLEQFENLHTSYDVFSSTREKEVPLIQTESV